MNDIQIQSSADYGYNFIPQEFLLPGEDEYRLRYTQQNGSRNYRALTQAEVAVLVQNSNRCSNWADVLVSEPFDASLVRGCDFAGLVRIGWLENVVLQHHDVRIPCGITNSRLIACDIGDLCAIHSCSYLAHYIIGDHCILLNNDEIHVSNHSKWGNGIIKEGESEDVRIWLDLMNEAGGRSVLPFDGMICADAWLWAKHRDNSELLRRLMQITEQSFEKRRGEYGTIGHACVIKNNHIIKDVKIGEAAYIKGANKLKNLTINSNDNERTQIGEGVELVNGIILPGCRIFYGCKAVRFVMGRNSALKYGARLIHSVLGDNSTVSCCELLNNLIFPAHEQHHNTSFLVAAFVGGQSNMAASATIGSNHNSRANDGEIQAGRGFWPGLSTSVKHNSRFASFCLLAKGDYKYELDIRFPLALVSNNESLDQLEIMPAYWWMYNMYALLRNKTKFAARDKRQEKVQHIEFSPFAPDVVEEVFFALELLERYTAQSHLASSASAADTKVAGAGAAELDDNELRKIGRDLLQGSAEFFDGLNVYAPDIENSHRKVLIKKPHEAYQAYREFIHYYAMRVLIGYFAMTGDSDALALQTAEWPKFSAERVREWENFGGQIVQKKDIKVLIGDINSGALNSWAAIHDRYSQLWTEYPEQKLRHAWASLCTLLNKDTIQKTDFIQELDKFIHTTHCIQEQVYNRASKDYTSNFRKCTFQNPAEMEAVLGLPETKDFVIKTEKKMEALRASANALRGILK